MNLKLINPMIATPQIAYDLGVMANQEQVIRFIEKILFSQSIICEEIKIIKSK